MGTLSLVKYGRPINSLYVTFVVWKSVASMVKAHKLKLAFKIMRPQGVYLPQMILLENTGRLVKGRLYKGEMSEKKRRDENIRI